MISEQENVATMTPDGHWTAPNNPTEAMLRPFVDCPEDELPIAYEAMRAIATRAPAPLGCANARGMTAEALTDAQSARLHVAGTVVELGTLEGEGGEIGVVVKRADGRFLTVKGFTEQEMRDGGPMFLRAVTVAIAAPLSQPSGGVQPTADKGAA